MFNWPGMGRLFFESMLPRDYPTIMALSFITAFLVLLGTLLADSELRPGGSEGVV